MFANSLWAATALAGVSLMSPGTEPAQPQPGQSIAGASRMQVSRGAELRTVEGPADHFTGKVTITGQFQRPAPSRVGGAIVRFEPGARTAWHTHPLGQTLIVTEGTGWTRADPRIPRRRRAVVPARAQALARRRPAPDDDPHRHPGIDQRLARDLDGEGHGGRISRRAAGLEGTPTQPPFRRISRCPL